jgi:uncharacterized tellurite resistance protein B-like protein
METGSETEEAIALARGEFLAAQNAIRADLLMLLRAAFADGPLNDTARAALRRAALTLGFYEDQVGLVMEPLERADGGSALLFASLGKERRAQLLRQALEVAAHDPELMARGDRLRTRLLALLELAPDDMPDP